MQNEQQGAGLIGCAVSAISAMVTLTLSGCGSTDLMTTADYNELSGPPPDAVVAYGDHELQFGHLRLPKNGEGPFPVAIVVHGGCWLSEYDLTGTEAMSAALTDAGVATWNIEYRRVGDAGGGWPGTFEDVAAAADHLRTLAERYPLDSERVIATGHSAGGHLALWLAARAKLPAVAPGSRAPLPIHGVVSLAGATDLISGEQNDLCDDAIRLLMGGDSRSQPARYALASPRQLLPLRIPQVLVNGLEDSIVAPTYSEDYARVAIETGDDARFLGVPGAGHFEVVAPGTPAFREVEAAILGLVDRISGSARSGS